MRRPAESAHFGGRDLNAPRLVGKDAPDHGGPDIREQLLEELRGAAFVLYQRVALGIGFEADRDAEGLDLGEVVDPQFGDGRQQQLTLDLIQDVGTNGLDERLAIGFIEANRRHLSSRSVAEDLRGGPKVRQAGCVLTQALEFALPPGGLQRGLGLLEMIQDRVRDFVRAATFEETCGQDRRS